MPKFKDGHKKPSNSGRKPGVPNKVTQDIREAYKMLIESNLGNLSEWLKKIAVKDPEKAIRILADLSEYVIPKLARTEHVGDKENPLNISCDLSKISTEALKELIGVGIIEKKP